MFITRINTVSRTIVAAVFVATFILTGCGTPGPTQPADTFKLDFSQIGDPNPSGVILFFVDGINADIFEEMRTAGELPNIQHYFIDRGLYAPRAVCNIPSVTLANETSVVTGQYPGHHGITGINWFDRNRLIWRNYETIAQKNTLDGDHLSPTIFQQFPDRTTLSLFFQAHRGATKFVENWTSAGPPYFFGWFDFVDRLTLHRFNILIDIARERREFPAFTIAYLLAPDFQGYRHGIESPEYRAALKHSDTQIGRVLKDLERAGLLEHIHIALISDHGMTEVRRHFPMNDFVPDELGLDVADARLWEKQSFQDRLQTYRQHSCVLYGSGDRYWALCLRKPLLRTDGRIDYAPWPQRPNHHDLRHYPGKHGPQDLIARLLEQPAVHAVAYPMGENIVRLENKRGCVEFTQPQGPRTPISYHIITGNDPLGWRNVLPDHSNEVIMTPRQWLTATAATDYPGLAEQLPAYFRAHRAGDLIAFADDDWDFSNQHHAGHGGLAPADMHTIMAIAGPNITPQRVDIAQTVDLMPTILDLFDREIPHTLDGLSLLPE